MTRPLLLLALTAVGCSFTSTVEVGIPGSGATAGPRIASMHMIGSDPLGVNDDALTSRSSLVRIDDEATCIDMVLRHPAGAMVGPTPLSVEVDGSDALTFQAALTECGRDQACLPPDSPLQPFTAETDERIAVEAERMCFAKLPRAHHDLVVGRDGLFAWRFRFVLADDPTRPIHAT
jgi:hypothetical protein